MTGSLAEAQERCRVAWQVVWDGQRQPAERFGMSFRSGWGACGELMSAVASFDVSDVTWRHDGTLHEVRFSCAFDTLKSVQLAVRDMPVADLRCWRERGCRDAQEDR